MRVDKTGAGIKKNKECAVCYGLRVNQVDTNSQNVCKPMTAK